MRIPGVETKDETLRQLCLACDGASGDKDLELRIAAKFEEAFEVFKRKQASYGPGNIAGFGERGCIVRMYDKMQRLKRLLWDGELNALSDETTQDTLIDMANYAIICMVVLDGGWPGWEGK